MDHFYQAFKNKKIFGYYDFLVGVAELQVNYKDLELMENLLALYSIKNRN